MNNKANLNRPVNTLFLIQSLDGKISTGASDKRDIDADIGIIGLEEGKKQYNEYEQTTDLHSLNSGRVFAKIGINEPQNFKKTIVSFILIDNTHLTEQGVKNLCQRSKTFYLVTSNKNHPAFNVNESNLEIIYYENEIDFPDVFRRFKQVYNIERITIQTGGTLNAIFLRQNLIDYVIFFIAPALVGGRNTASSVDGQDILTVDDLKQIKTLELIDAHKLKDSFLRLEYRVVN